MRRGLISWSKVELPEATLDGRVASVQRTMANAGLDALVVYTNPARTAGVSWATGFVPYWNEGLLVIPRDRRPVLISALSNRVKDWIERNAHVERVLNNPRIGAEAGKIVAETKARARVGVVDLARLPAGVVHALREAGHEVVDGSAVLASARAAADPAELALATRAAHITHAALATASRRSDAAILDAAGLIAAVEGEARRLGAEEVYPAIAADLATSRALIRLEGTAALGALAAVRVSVAYKGVWVRMTRTFARNAADAAKVDAALVAFAAAVARLPDTGGFSGCTSWLIESTLTSTPLEPIAGTIIDDPHTPGEGSLVTVQALIEQDGIPVLLAGPVLVGRAGAAASLIVAQPFSD